MNIFERVDNFLFDAKYGYENISKRIQSITGIDCFDQAIVCSIISSVIIIRYYSGILIYFIMETLVFIITIIQTYLAKSRNTNKKFKNIQRINPSIFYLRMAVIFLMISSFNNKTLIISNFLLVCTWYLMACTPLPPGDSWLKEKWDNFRDKEKLALQE